jgi:hypothetical protein
MLAQILTKLNLPARILWLLLVCVFVCVYNIYSAFGKSLCTYTMCWK